MLDHFNIYSLDHSPGRHIITSACRVSLNFMYSKYNVIHKLKICREANIAAEVFPKHTNLCSQDRVYNADRDRYVLLILINWILLFFFTVSCHPLRGDVSSVLGGTDFNSLFTKQGAVRSRR
jgi:hypothetical protein